MRKLKLNEQSELLRYCKTQSKKLSSELEKLGLSYDSLIYENNKRIDNLLPEFSLKYKTLSEFKKRKKDMPLVSFFSGCGGLDLGFEFAGFKTVAMIEISEIFCNTLRDNFSTTVIGPPEYNGDVRDTDAIIEIIRSLFKTPFLLGFDVGVLTEHLQVSPKDPERKVSDEHAISISDRPNRRAMAAAVSLLALASWASWGSGSSAPYSTFGAQWDPLSG